MRARARARVYKLCVRWRTRPWNDIPVCVFAVLAPSLRKERSVCDALTGGSGDGSGDGRGGGVLCCVAVRGASAVVR